MYRNKIEKLNIQQKKAPSSRGYSSYSDFNKNIKSLMGKEDITVNNRHYNQITNRNVAHASGLYSLEEKQLNLVIATHGKRVNQRLVALSKADENIQGFSRAFQIAKSLEETTDLMKRTKSGHLAFNLNTRGLSIEDKRKLAQQIISFENMKSSTVGGTRKGMAQTVKKVSKMFNNPNIDENTIGNVFGALNDDKFYAWYKSHSKEDISDITKNIPGKEIFESKEKLLDYFLSVTNNGKAESIITVLEKQQTINENYFQEHNINFEIN